MSLQVLPLLITSFLFGVCRVLRLFWKREERVILVDETTISLQERKGERWRLLKVNLISYLILPWLYSSF